jgi:KDO2-lipid IV(A) lauroyltransferase
LPVLRCLPPSAANAYLEGMGSFRYDVVPGKRADYLRAVARGRVALGGNWDDDAVARKLSAGIVLWRCRDRLLDGLSDSQALSRFDVEGRDHLDAALSLRRGVILLGNHFGSHMHPSHWLFRAGYPLRLFMERPRNVSNYLTSQLATDGPLGQEKLFISRRSTPVEAAGSILRASRILKAGMILKIAGDVRWDGGHTSPGHFLGSTYLFSTTWVVLAAMSGAPVVPVFCRPDGQGRSLLEFLPYYRIPADVPRCGQAARYVQKALDAVTEQVRERPDLSNDYLSWPMPSIGLMDRVA